MLGHSALPLVSGWFDVAFCLTLMFMAFFLMGISLFLYMYFANDIFFNTKMFFSTYFISKTCSYQKCLIYLPHSDNSKQKCLSM